MNPFELLAEIQKNISVPYERKRALEEREYSRLKDRLEAGFRVTDEERQWLLGYEQFLMDIGKDPVPCTQSIVDYAILKKIKRELDDTIVDRTTFTVYDKIVLGSIESLNINACIYKVNDIEECLILINRGVLGAIQGISNIISYVVDIDDSFWIKGVISERLSNTKSYFVDIISKYVLCLSSEDYMRIPLRWGSIHEAFWNLLDMSTRIFVVGHEYGHFLLGHFHEPKHLLPNIFPIRGDDVESKEMIFKWRQEYEADIAGYDLCVLTGQRVTDDNIFGILMAWQAIVLFFEILHLFNRVFDIDRRLIPKSSHPSPTLRVNNLMAYTHRKVDSTSLMEHLMDIKYGITNSLATLWYECENDVRMVVDANVENLIGIRERLVGHK